MKKRYALLLLIVLAFSIINLFLFMKIDKQNGYYIGKIESMEKKDRVTTVEISPISSTLSFASEIQAKHKIAYADDIGIAGLKDRGKERKDLYLGQLGEAIENLKVGDPIIFKVRGYDKNNYKLEIDELAVDLTVE